MIIPMFSFLPSVKKLDKMVKKIDKHISDIIKSRFGINGKNDILNELLNTHNDIDVYHQISTLLSAGHDTTGLFSCYMIYLLSSNQRVQNKVKKEIINSDIDKMKYCKMVLIETLRLYTIIPFVTRNSTKDYKIKNKMKFLRKNPGKYRV
jgi:cytochrome P450